MFTFLVLLSAFLIEGIGTYVSVVGLSALFASNPVIIVLAIALDLGKVIGVSFLYKYGRQVNWFMRTYMLIAMMVLMLITSTGAFGYLSGQFQKAIAGTNQDSIVLTSLTDEQGRLQKRKEEIDAQIAKLPDNNVRGRTQLMRQFGPEVGRINKRLEDIDKQLPDLKVASIKKDVEVGPIIYIAQAFNTDPEHAVKWVILTIIFVFDPLAIALLLAGNFLIERKKKKVEDDGSDDKAISQHYGHSGLAAALEKFDIEKHGGEVMVPEVTNVSPAPINLQDVVPKSPPSSQNYLHLEQYGHQRYTEPLIDQFDHLQHEHLGRERYEEPLTDQLDHLTHENLGRHKVYDPEESNVRPALPEEVSPEREVILLHDVMPPKLPKSSLESITDKSDVETDEDTRQWLKPLRQEYQKDIPPS